MIHQPLRLDTTWLDLSISWIVISSNCAAFQDNESSVTNV